MDSLDWPTTSDGKPSPRQLQGPRPTPLKVRKDSHKIKKPPIAPPAQQQQQQNPPQHRPPVIIYAVSPKVIHTNPSEFMSIVQRLTGPSSSPLPSPSAYSLNKMGQVAMESTNNNDYMESLNIDATVIEKSPTGILSSPASSLSPIPPNFFSTPTDQNPLSFLHDLSPIFHGNRNFIEGTFVPSPSANFFSSPTTTSFDLFNHFSDY
ncbi:hypothetical protein GIB67_036089 [Kingdonia uniflora]|uniref:VQ domain-containing protein n=1 Tax=Kingdonia uniflora TaxID=39325 RepID=A0A7J7N8R9_9MAGN|nr:hypothetical protein GIB67_036089 [Kingdonia uniflora]